MLSKSLSASTGLRDHGRRRALASHILAKRLECRRDLLKALKNVGGDECDTAGWKYGVLPTRRIIKKIHQQQVA
jgi:hypothetical protein